jgi:iron complex transport system permease protein
MRSARGWIALLVIAVACVAARLLVARSLDGTLQLGWQADAAAWRLGAVTSGAAAGAALALSGLLLQSLLRNPLASPFVLGLSGGAQAAMALAALLAWKAGAQVSPAASVVVGCAGSMVALLLCIAFGRSRERGLDPVSLVLAGVVVAAMLGALATLCEWMLPPSERAAVHAWGLGRVPEAPPTVLLVALLLVLGVAAVGAWSGGRALDAMQLSDDEARSVGVPLAGMRWSIVLGASALAAAATALCGPLAFVGLVAPHAARGLLGGAHRRTVPATLLVGAALLVLADATRAIIPVEGGRLPVGVVCALAGGPAFLMLLRRGAAGAWRT